MVHFMRNDDGEQYQCKEMFYLITLKSSGRGKNHGKKLKKGDIKPYFNPSHRDTYYR